MDEHSKTLALFILDPDTGEADGTVYYFCSDTCRMLFKVDGVIAYGNSPDAIPGTVCDECGGTIEISESGD